jgi:hypothetical protein
MWRLSEEDRTRLGSLLAARAVNKASDAESAKNKNRHPNLIKVLEEDSRWCREMASLLLSDDDMEG